MNAYACKTLTKEGRDRLGASFVFSSTGGDDL